MTGKLYVINFLVKDYILKENLLFSLRSNEGGEPGVRGYPTAFENCSVAAEVDKQLTLERFFSYVPFKAPRLARRNFNWLNYL